MNVEPQIEVIGVVIHLDRDEAATLIDGARVARDYYESQGNERAKLAFDSLQLRIESVLGE